MDKGNKIIGIANKNHEFMESMLQRNIGSNQHVFDGYSTIIGNAGNPYLNSEYDAWFMVDEDKQKYDNYLSYLNSVYFHGTMLPSNFQTFNKSLDLTSYNGFVNEHTKIGSVRGYDLMKNDLDSSVNPNGLTDTRLGVLNNFYLKANLYRTYEKNSTSPSSSYQNPSYGSEYGTNANSFSVTQGAYSKFGLTGAFGMVNGHNYPKNGTVIPQSLLTDDVILWSTSDYTYNSDDSLIRVGDMLGVDTEYLSNKMDDNTRGVSQTYQYHPFGNFYSLTYSLGLLSSSGGRTKEFIAKSIYGIDLMSDYLPSLNYDDMNHDAIKSLTRKKYFASIGSRGTNYIDMMTSVDVGYESNSNGQNIRLLLNDPGNDNFSTFNTYLTYAEAEDNKQANVLQNSLGNAGTNVGRYETYSINTIKSKKDIINYTNEQFSKNKFKTIIGRFHTDRYKDANDAKLKKDQTSSAVSQYGMSHGRNLLKRNHKNSQTNGFDDPYCRVWTYHKQYSKYSDLIRPFDSDQQKELDESLSLFQPNRKDLHKYGVKNTNTKLLNIAPEKDKTACMFSIENLAWKGNEGLTLNGSNYKKGPEGGRIMWFPPYDLTFSESVNARWNETSFIGRGEKIYSYVDTTRSGRLSFLMLIDHPSIINAFDKKNGDTTGDVDDVNSKEQQLLRFFAGCEVLKVKKKENVNQVILPSSGSTDFDNSENVNKLSFSVYFPNNYSGIDDSSSLFVEYLCSGVGRDISIGKDCYLDLSGNTKFGGYERNHMNGISGIKKWDNNKPQPLICKYYYKDSSNQFIENNLIAFQHPQTKNRNKTNYWGYRIDKKYAGQNLVKSNNYLDTISNCLNETPTLNNKSEKQCSFIDFVGAMDNRVFITHYNKMEHQQDIESIKNIFGGNGKLVGIKLIGYSSKAGHVKLNDDLAKDRVNSVKKWLKGLDIFSEIQTKNVFEQPETNPSNDGIGVNDITSKKNRRVDVEFYFSTEEIEEDLNTQNISFPKYDSQNQIEQYSTRKKSVSKTSDSNKWYRNSINLYDNISYSNIVNASAREGFMDSIATTALENINEVEYKLNQLNSTITNESDAYGELSEYNEADFFNFVESSDTMLRHKLIEKIKYFDPAFHSVTPEGFNSRLTFLHQCTRQGATKSATDTGGKNIANLSFGKPPICVLRIGDFYNTKIVINNLDISYDESCWDLNDEGIGVMPMMAKIDIGFNFIGGSDLSGPISRLQNAVSFNYYANTRVYENNAINKQQTIQPNNDNQ